MMKAAQYRRYRYGRMAVVVVKDKLLEATLKNVRTIGRCLGLIRTRPA